MEKYNRGIIFSNIIFEDHLQNIPSAPPLPNYTNNSFESILPSAPSFEHYINQLSNEKCDDSFHLIKANISDYNRLNNMMISKGFYEELSKFFCEQIYKVTKTFFILDTSASMSSSDGKIFDEGKIIKCSRFTEMQKIVKDVFSLFFECQIPSKFTNLKCEYVDTLDSHININSIDEIVSVTEGETSLKVILNNLKSEINYSSGQKKLVIITDGKSHNSDIAKTLKEIQGFDVSITIRLFTDDEKSITYWNNINKDLEIKLDIINSYFNEIIKVKKYNPKLNYTTYFHKLREYGVIDPRFHHIDQISLSKYDIKYLNEIAGPKNSKNYYKYNTGVIS